MTAEAPLLCVACHDELATPGSFLCTRCLPEPEPEMPAAFQPGLFESVAA